MKTSRFGWLGLAMALVNGGAVAQVGGGISAISGVSGGLGIDFAGSQVAGAATENDGGLAKSLDEAFDESKSKSKSKDAKAAPKK
ncbi:MAG: hypothetical protein ACT4QA_23045 [Panacagrimonas sp.]